MEKIVISCQTLATKHCVARIGGFILQSLFFATWQNGFYINASMPHVYLHQRERFRAATLKRLGISDELFDQFNRTVAPHVQQVRFRKGEFIQCCAHPALAAYWLHGGVTRRGIFTREGVDLTMGFAIEGEACGSHHDLLAGQEGKPAMEFIVAETPVSAARVEWATLIRLREQHEHMREYYMKVAEYSLRLYTENCYLRSLTSAADRLTAFRERYPGLEERISQKALASFLGITPQYMSTMLRRARQAAAQAHPFQPGATR